MPAPAPAIRQAIRKPLPNWSSRSSSCSRKTMTCRSGSSFLKPSSLKPRLGPSPILPHRSHPPQSPEETPAEQIPPAPATVAVPHDWHDVHGIQFRGFGEVDYKVLNQRQPELGTDGFVPGS